MRFRCHWTRINRFVSTLSRYVFDCPHVTASFLVVLGNFGCDVICRIARTGLGTRLRSDRIARYDVSSTRNQTPYGFLVQLYARTTNTRTWDISQPTWYIWGVIFFISIRFQPFLTVHTNTMCMRFRFDQLPRAFWNLCVVDENAQRTSVNGRPTGIKMPSFSKENARIRGFSFEIGEFFLPCNASFRNKDTNAETY